MIASEEDEDDAGGEVVIDIVSALELEEFLMTKDDFSEWAQLYLQAVEKKMIDAGKDKAVP